MRAETGIAVRGILSWRRHVCRRCRRVLDTAWSHCVYCEPIPAGDGPDGLGWLVPIRGPARGQVISLGAGALLGSAPECAVRMSEEFVSARHAELRAFSREWRVRDLGSTNGTFINDRRLAESVIEDGDILRFGSALAVFKCL